ncbi:hypothetical protein ON010_g19039 [Phytophthora cinnamomi]|nr:hypothetical protein ON010_g19039 [Phytophthora cinnamomi]
MLPSASCDWNTSVCTDSPGAAPASTVERMARPPDTDVVLPDVVARLLSSVSVSSRVSVSTVVLFSPDVVSVSVVVSTSIVLTSSPLVDFEIRVVVFTVFVTMLPSASCDWNTSVCTDSPGAFTVERIASDVCCVVDVTRWPWLALWPWWLVFPSSSVVVSVVD